MKLKARYNWELQDWVWFPYKPEQLELHMKLAAKYPYDATRQQVVDNLKQKHHDSSSN